MGGYLVLLYYRALLHRLRLRSRIRIADTVGSIGRNGPGYATNVINQDYTLACVCEGTVPGYKDLL
jgi:hypothetical protein